jgi:hypothetical protein
MSESEDFKLLSQLEQTTDWDESGIDETGDDILLSLDTVCYQLVGVFCKYITAVDLNLLDEKELVASLAKALMMIERDFCAQQDLLIDSVLQTRGNGLCMTVDKNGRPSGFYELTDKSRLRGQFIGIECLPVPTDYAMITRQYDQTDNYEPAFCLVLEDTNICELDDHVDSCENIAIIPLQVGGIGIDRVVAR